MARRLSSTAALLLLLLSLLTVAHCRPVEADPATDAAGSAGDDGNGPPNPTLPSDAVLPAEQQPHGFLRLPSHRLRRHHPCSRDLFNRHLWWARHHGTSAEDAPRRFHGRHGEAALSHLMIASPAGETGEAKSVAEPDPDRSLPDGDDGEGEVAAGREPYSFPDADGGAHDHEEAAVAREGEAGAAVRAWRKEMQRRWRRLHRHGMRLHRHHHDEEEEVEAAGGLKRFRHADDEHEDESDSEDEDEEVEELVRRFRKAIMRRRSSSGHGRRFHHHRHAGEAAGKADAAQEEGGVVSWIKDLIMNRF
jgi:hypothetical protein